MFWEFLHGHIGHSNGGVEFPFPDRAMFKEKITFRVLIMGINTDP